MSGLRVAVAGGGLGGLCLAQGLLKAGVDVTVYERDPQLAARRQGYRLHVDETFLVRVRTSPPVPPWPPSRVTLLGDAIHAMSPARGSGANTALQDAALLCRTLTGAGRTGAGRTGAGRTGGDLIAAVGEYERQMRDYGYAAVAASSQAEAETGMRHNRFMFWLYRRMTGTRG